MQLTALLTFEKYGLKHIQGPLEQEVTEVLPPDRCFNSSLVFVSKQELVETALGRGANALIKTPGVEVSAPDTVSVFEIPSVSIGLALILPFFEKKAERFENSNHASIHPTAKLGDGVVVGAFAVIGAHCIIGQGCKIGSHVTIENNCVIGAKTILHPHVFVGADTEIGTECEIHSHTTLGSDGFGYVTNPSDGRHHKVPQIGRVILEDRVEIGANTAIDRATLTETRIKSGTKIDNLVHIAHNCEIGQDSLITAGFMVAGSSKIGRQFVSGGQAAVTDHVVVADNVSLAGRGGIMQSITEPGSYGGFPAVKIQQYLKTTRAMMDLPEIWKSWRKQEKANQKN